MKAVRFFVVIGVIVISIVALFVFSYQKNNKLSVPTYPDIDTFVQAYFNKKYEILLQSTPTQERSSIKMLSAFYTTKHEASRYIEELQAEKAANAYGNFIYKNAVIRTKIQELKTVEKTTSAHVLVSFSIETNAADEESGDPIVLQGIENYDLVLIAEDNSWKIVREEKTQEFWQEVP